jgi:hypothetical protein
MRLPLRNRRTLQVPALGQQTAPNGQSSQSALWSGYVDADCPFRMRRDKECHGILNGRIAYQVINSGRIGNLLAILNHTSDMKAQGFCRSAPRFFQSSTSRNAPRKIWEAHAKIRFTILMQICDVIYRSPQPKACLLFDASQYLEQDVAQ